VSQRPGLRGERHRIQFAAVGPADPDAWLSVDQIDDHQSVAVHGHLAYGSVAFGDQLTPGRAVAGGLDRNPHYPPARRSVRRHADVVLAVELADEGARKVDQKRAPFRARGEVADRIRSRRDVARAG